MIFLMFTILSLIFPIFDCIFYNFFVIILLCSVLIFNIRVALQVPLNKEDLGNFIVNSVNTFRIVLILLLTWSHALVFGLSRLEYIIGCCPSFWARGLMFCLGVCCVAFEGLLLDFFSFRFCSRRINCSFNCCSWFLKFLQLWTWKVELVRNLLWTLCRCRHPHLPIRTPQRSNKFSSQVEQVSCHFSWFGYIAYRCYLYSNLVIGSV